MHVSLHKNDQFPTPSSPLTTCVINNTPLSTNFSYVYLDAFKNAAIRNCSGCFLGPQTECLDVY